MESALRSTHRSKFLIMPAIFSIVYAMGAFGFVLLQAGMQYIPGFAGFEKYGLVYTALCLLGAISNIAIMRRHRWGVTGQICVWAASSAVNIFLHRGIEQTLGVAILLVILWGLDVYRNFRH
jgi:hypothetical protein